MGLSHMQQVIFLLWQRGIEGDFAAPSSSSRPSPAAADASRDPDNVPAKAGNQTPNDVIKLSLDSGSRPAKRRSSGMTGSVNCDIVSKGRGDFGGAKLRTVYSKRLF